MSINYLGRGIAKSHAFRIVKDWHWGMRSSEKVRTAIRLLPRLGMRIQPLETNASLDHPSRMNGIASFWEHNSEKPLSRGRLLAWPTNARLRLKGRAPIGKVCPERKLAVAVFSQAANDPAEVSHARRGADYSLYADARNWITSNDRKWPY